MKPLNIAIVGCGRIAEAHLQAINALPHLKLTALCDANFAAAQKLAALSATDGVELFADHRFMAEAVHLDGVIVCTPPATHPAIAIDLMERGAHVLSEKPLAIALPIARDMFAAASRYDRILTMASKFRYVDDVVAARELIRSGAIGEPVQCNVNFCSPVAMAGRWNADRALSGGGVLMDNGPHAADIMRFLFGPIISVLARHGRDVQELPVEETTQLSLETASGVLGTIDLSWSCAAATDYYLQVSGTQGVLAVGWSHSRWRRNGERDWRVLGNGYDKGRAFIAQLEQFAACLRGEALPSVSPQAALATVEVIARAYQSADQGAWLPIGQTRALIAA